MLVEVQYDNEEHGVKSAKFAFNPLGILQKGRDIALIIDLAVYHCLTQDPNDVAKTHSNSPVGTVQQFYEISYEDFMKYAEEELARQGNLMRIVRMYGPQFPTRNKGPKYE